MHPTIDKALKHLQNANYAGYFDEMDKVVPSALKNPYAEHKGVFISGQTPWNFYQKLEVFAKQVNGEISQIQKNQNTKQMDRKTLFELLNQAFDDGSLQNFCFLYFPEVEGNFALGQTKNQKIIALLTHCEQHLKLRELEERIKEERPAMYQQFVSK
ncbi:MAG: hypothetical protein MUE81_22375 [Thermoflexibacter sp.]|jgi:hypothetical protein|nr:hypothetical protein [Thermoflexibacter sp.]